MATLSEGYEGTVSSPPWPPRLPATLVLFKASLLQRWYNLSDPGLEETTGRNYGFLIASVCHFCSSYLLQLRAYPGRLHFVDPDTEESVRLTENNFNK